MFSAIDSWADAIDKTIILIEKSTVTIPKGRNRDLILKENFAEYSHRIEIFAALQPKSGHIETVEGHGELAATAGHAAQIGDVAQQPVQSAIAVDGRHLVDGAGIADDGVARL